MAAYRNLAGFQIFKYSLPPSKRVKQWLVFSQQWHLYDAKWQNPFTASMQIARVISGRHKPIGTHFNETGDHVVVINSRHIALPEDEWTRRVYFHHTGYPGGASWTKAFDLHSRDPTLILWKAVYRELGGNLQRRRRMPLLHIFPDEEIPEGIRNNINSQLRQEMHVPKALEDYSPEERANFPKIFDWPQNYAIEEKNTYEHRPLPTGGYDPYSVKTKAKKFKNPRIFNTGSGSEKRNQSKRGLYKLLLEDSL